jgi:protein-S-isoprenylcysteine O-methyltransferase Ste14
MERRPFYSFATAQIVALIALLWIVFSHPAPWDFQRICGAALMIAGISGLGTARYQLGNSFSLKPEAHQLVTHGMYSKIRNPIYMFGSVLVAGLVLVLHRPILWLLLVAIVVMQTLRARREAEVLETAFGDAYREYCRKTWF